jgi:hypothetical protein
VEVPVKRIALILALSATLNTVLGSQPVTLKPQETNDWCWAATTQMITEFLGHGRTQCDLANARFSREDCCTGTCPKNPACKTPGWTMFKESDFETDVSNKPLEWADLKDQIDKKKPMSYAYGPKSGGVGHVVVISGYAETNGVTWVELTDPFERCKGTIRYIKFNEYLNSETSDHWETNYNIRYTK